jgi:spore maturation protein CgeB
VIWVNGGEFLSRRALTLLASLHAPIVLYNNDDPMGPRDGRRFIQVRRSLDLYQLCVALREPSAADMRAAGAKRVMRVPFSYDEIEHAPVTCSEIVHEKFHSDIGFVGTWMRGEARDLLLEQLRRTGLRVSIWGPRWEKSPFRQLVKECWRGAWISGRNYVYAVSGAKVVIGLVSKGNRDLHTQRSVEIPYAGGLLCAERTSEHMTMFKDAHEAVFWDSHEACVQVCQELVANQARRRSIVENGMRRVRELKVGNEDVCRRVLDAIFA